MIKHCGGKQTYKAASVIATHSATQQKDKWSIVEKKKKSRSAIRLGMPAEVCAVWKPLSKSQSTPTGSSSAGVRLLPLAMSGTVLDGCTSFYLLTTGVLLFPCRWPIHSLLPLTSPSFLPLNGQKRPPCSIEGQWKASDHHCVMFANMGCYVERYWKVLVMRCICCMVVTGSAVKPQIIFISVHKRMRHTDTVHKCRHGPAPLG